MTVDFSVFDLLCYSTKHTIMVSKTLTTAETISRYENHREMLKSHVRDSIPLIAQQQERQRNLRT